MKKLSHSLLLPFSLVYGTILCLRNKLYDIGIIHTTAFDFPVIVVGNLNLGGVGKTPHVEYLIRLLKNNFKVATLSRGYKRKTIGFLLSDSNSTANDIGDEPLQYKKKFNTIPVAVDEKRARGIQLLKEKHPELNIIILDDAYQHRAVKAGINILITDYNNLYVNDLVLPAGRLREWQSGSNRADIIIVSKSPSNLSLAERTKTIKSLNPKPHQSVYFSYLKYGPFSAGNTIAKELNTPLNNNTSILLITGIANPQPLLIYLKTHFKTIQHIPYKDHHEFIQNDITHIKNEFRQLNGNKIIVTTEKDLMRLSLPQILIAFEGIPLFYLPIEVDFHGDDKENFDKQIMQYVTKKTSIIN
ncbi:MAG: tetraacyldisaccharide 4'-kinase [Vicingus serpentipes]|nr:tetraacyldisaccharide 4'-kinase [Vicingus serpentipes]